MVRQLAKLRHMVVLAGPNGLLGGIHKVLTCHLVLNVVECDDDTCLSSDPPHALTTQERGTGRVTTVRAVDIDDIHDGGGMSSCRVTCGKLLRQI